ANSFVLNVGNSNPSITTLVVPMKGGDTDFSALDFLLDEAEQSLPLQKTIVYFRTRAQAREASIYLRHKLPPGSPYRRQLFALFATKDVRAKARIMNMFRSGELVILFATEAAGMVSD
ncbi:hypothetical protein BDW22DRAFT_1299112, partial [Trametopsis cervina]